MLNIVTKHRTMVTTSDSQGALTDRDLLAGCQQLVSGEIPGIVSQTLVIYNFDDGNLFSLKRFLTQSSLYQSWRNVARTFHNIFIPRINTTKIKLTNFVMTPIFLETPAGHKFTWRCELTKQLKRKPLCCKVRSCIEEQNNKNLRYSSVEVGAR